MTKSNVFHYFDQPSEDLDCFKIQHTNFFVSTQQSSHFCSVEGNKNKRNPQNSEHQYKKNTKRFQNLRTRTHDFVRTHTNNKTVK